MRLCPLLIVGLAGCSALGPVADQSPTSVFDSLWSEFDLRYGLFEVKQVDWQAAYDEHRPRVSDDMSEAQLREVLHDMLLPLQDDHTWLWSGEPMIFSAFTPPRERGEVDFDLVLSELLTEGDAVQDSLTWGFLTPDVGYIRIHNFEFPNHEAVMARAMRAVGSAGGLVVDARDNPGGRDAVSAALAGCFADETTPFMRVRIRNGPEHSDFGEPIDWSVQPRSDCSYDKPVVLLTNAFTVSAGDVFAMAMVELPRVTHIGEHTTGAFSDTIPRELPNGWVYGFSVGDWRDARDVSHEGVGIVPAIEVINNVKALSQGRDVALEKAIEVLVGER